MNSGRVLEEVKVRPGAHKSELCRALGLTWGTLGRRLHDLQERGLVRLVRARQRTRVYLPAPDPLLTARLLRAPGKTKIPRAEPARRELAPAAQARVRRLVLEAVAQKPGITKSQLCERYGQAWGTVAYHVNRLVECGEVLVLRRGRHMRLFPPDMDPERMQMVALVAEDVPAAIAARLVEGPRRLGELADDLTRGPPLVSHHLASLGKAGIVERRGREYHLRPDARSVLLQLLRDDAPEAYT